MPVTTMKAASDLFLAELTAQANEAIGTANHAEILPIDFSGTGDFHWYFQVDRGFNYATYNQISQRVGWGATGQPSIHLIDSFPNAYVQVLRAIEYKFSKEDEKKVIQATDHAKDQAASLVGQWEQQFEFITPAMLEAAKVRAKVDYVLRVIRTEWAPEGKKVTIEDMQKARNLADLLPNTPGSGLPLLPIVTLYLAALGESISLCSYHDEQNWILQQLIANTTKPTDGPDGNGGMRYVDPKEPVTPTKLIPAYNVQGVPSDIRRALENKGAKIHIEMQLEKGSSQEFHLSIKGRGTGSFGSLIKVTGEGSFDYEVTNRSSNFDRATVTMHYEGVNLLPFAPKTWDQATNRGWFYALPIAQAVKNGNDPLVSGYKFSVVPTGYNFTGVQGGNFGMLQGLVISTAPTITMEFEHADYAYFKRTFEQTVKVKVKVLGLFTIAESEEHSYSSEMSYDQHSSKVTITLKPPVQTVATPDLDKVAHIIGGTWVFPVADANTAKK